MHIALDARELCGHPTGVGRYLASLLEAWQRTGTPHRITLYAPAVPEWASTHAGIDIRVIPGPPGTWWEQVQLPRALAADRPDVLFAPAYTAPLRTPIPCVLTIHDLSFAAHPEWFSPREGLRRRWLTRQSARRAAGVITVSEFSRQEVLRRYGLPEARVHAIHSGLPSVDGAPTAAATALNREPLVLYSGSIFNRRHVPDLIRAFAQAAASDPAARLVIVGDDRSHPAQPLRPLVASLALSRQVELRRYVPDAELAQLYARACVFAFLSEYEGFGFTPLEALQAGVPIVVADTPVAREIYGDAAVFVKVGDVPGCAAALRRLLDDGCARREVLSRAPAVLARYSWDRAGAETLSVIEEAPPPRAAVALRLAQGDPEHHRRVAQAPESTFGRSAKSGELDLAIVIVSYNAAADLQRCLRSLHDAPPALSYEIVVVDNASTDGSPAVAQRWPGVRLIQAGDNLGFARANNLGIRESASEMILLLNNDTIVQPGAIDRLAADLRAHPEAAIAGPRIVDGAGRTELSFGRMIGPFSELRQKLLVRLHERGTWPIAPLVERRTRQAATHDWVSGACLLVRRADAEAAGLLDERYFLYTEDVDFCAAVRAHGRAVRFVPDAQIIHLRGRSGASAPRATERMYRESRLQFYEKHHPRWAPWLRRYLRVCGRLPRE